MTKHDSWRNAGAVGPITGDVAPDVTPRQLSDELISLSVMWRSRYRILLASFASATLVLGILVNMTPTYEATGQVMVAGGESRVIDIENVAPDSVANEPVLQGEVAVLTSTSLLQSVAAELELASDPEFNPYLREKNLLSTFIENIRSIFFPTNYDESQDDDVIKVAAAVLKNHLTIQPLGISFVIQVTASSESPTLAAQIANSVIKEYLDRQIESKLAASERATAWLKERVDRLRADLIEAENRLEDYKANAAEEGYSSETAVVLRELQREVDASRAVYEQFLIRLKETRERGSFQEPDAKIVSLAEVPNATAGPQKLLLVMLAGFGGGMMAVAASLIVEGRRYTLISERDVSQHCGIPLIGNIPKVPNVTNPLEVLDWMRTRPYSALAEAIRWLSVSLEAPWNDENKTERSKVVVVTSALPGEGKTTLAVLLAQSSASGGSKTLLFDADLRRRSISEALSAAEAGPKFIEDLGFTVYRCGDIIGGEQGVLSGKVLHDVLSAARERYETIIIDAPPVLSVSDIAKICGNADATIIVCRWEVTPRGAVQQAIQMLQSFNVNLKGFVFTMVDLKRQAEASFTGGGYALRQSMKYYTDQAVTRRDG